MVLRMSLKSMFVNSVVLVCLLIWPISVFTAEQSIEKVAEEAVEKAANFNSLGLLRVNN